MGQKQHYRCWLLFLMPSQWKCSIQHRQECDEYGKNCRQVPANVCDKIAAVPVCREVPSETCRAVPGPGPGRSCHQAPQQVCTRVAVEVPVEECQEVTRTVCQGEPGSTEEDECETVTEEECQLVPPVDGLC